MKTLNMIVLSTVAVLALGAFQAQARPLAVATFNTAVVATKAFPKDGLDCRDNFKPSDVDAYCASKGDGYTAGGGYGGQGGGNGSQGSWEVICTHPTKLSITLKCSWSNLPPIEPEDSLSVDSVF